MPTWRFVITVEASDRDDALVRFADLFEAGIPPEVVVAGPGENGASPLQAAMVTRARAVDLARMAAELER